MKYFLDTNIIIYYMNGKYPSIKNHFLTIPSTQIAIPVIVNAEIEYGAQKSYNYSKTISEYNKFTTLFESIPFTIDAAKHYGEIRAYLQSIGLTIGPNDLLIAAIVRSQNGTLVTHNTREFSRIPNLKIEDWTEM